MSTQGRPLIIGHSHAGALFEAAATASIATDNVSLWIETDPFEVHGDVLTLREDLARRIREAPQVISTVGGGSFLMLAFATVERPFEFVPPWSPRPNLEPGVEIVPTRAVMAAFRTRERVHAHLLRAIVQAACGRVVHVAPPPPPRAWVSPAALAMLRKREESVGADAVRRATSPSAQRRTLALWRLALELQREVCTDLAIALRPPPRGTVDDDGYLLPTYSHDLAHANAAYGRAVLADLGLLEEGPRA